MNRRTVMVIITLALLLALAGFALWRPSSRSAFPSFILTNGARVTFVSAEFPNLSNRGGWLTLNRYDGGWRDKVYPKLPRSVLTKFGIQPISFISVGSNLALWLKFSDLPPGPPGAPPQQYYRLRVQDPAGFSSPDNWPMITASTNLALYTIANYPQRGSNVELQLVYGDWKNRGAETVGPLFTVQDKFPKSPTHWIPESLPATRVTNGLTITLDSLQTGLASMSIDPRAWPGSTGARCYTHAAFEIIENGRLARNWKVLKLKATAATGETIGENPSSLGWMQGKFIYVFPAALWTEEPAWKVEVELQETSEFPTNELVVLKEVRLPRDNAETVDASPAVKFDGVEGLSLSLATTAAGASYVRIPPDSRAISINARLVNHDPSLRLTPVRISDERDALLTVQSSTESQNAGASGLLTSTYEYSVFLSTNSASLNATFAVTRSRFATFFVKPSVAQWKNP